MTVPGNIDALLLGGQRGYQIERSLRFNSADSAYLNRTPASAGNRKTWTWSAWVKRGNSSNAIFSTNSGDNLTYNYFGFSSDSFRLYQWNGSGYDFQLITSAVYRDQSAWYHFVISVDTTQGAAADRVKFYVNGAQVTAFSTTTNPSQNLDTYVNSTSYSHLLGRNPGGSSTYFDGYLTEVHFIDGQALTPSNFGETDTITGVWKPKRYSGSSYGTNGFYLNFKDNSSVAASTLGKDYSGNGNNWTPSATFSVTPGVGNDSLIDTPTPYADGGNGRGNYCTLNPLDSTATLSNGNLTQTATAERSSRSTFQIPSSGLWYAEATATSTTNGSTISCGFGLAAASVSLTANPYSLASAWNLYSSNAAYINRNGTPSSSLGFTLTAGDVVQIAVDPANNRAWIGRNNTWYNSTTGTTGDPAGGTNPTVSSLPAGLFVFANTFNQTWDVNFGQRAFAYTPPSGFLALNTQNLPEPSIKKPNQYFDVNTWTGTSATNPRTNSGSMQPDLLWVKNRNGTNWPVLFDSARGVSKYLRSDSTGNEVTDAQYLTSFDSGGFTLGADLGGLTNYSGLTYVGWQWKESATPGFDIVSFNSGAAGNKTQAHSLGVAPAMIIVKSRDSSTFNWAVWHQSFATPAQGYLALNTTAAVANDSRQWANTAPTSTVFSYESGYTFTANQNIVAYLWSEVAGFSKFGSYTGNGLADGPFVACNFRPRWLLIKRTDSANDWVMKDAARNSYNTTNLDLYANTSQAEVTFNEIDFTSNGFKIRNSNASTNASGGTYVFAAFAEFPAKYSLAR